MAISNQIELLESLESGDHDLILGTPESSWLDFKRKAYESTPTALSRKGRYELCKDVAALANEEGGVILIGVAEKLSPINGLSVADKITPLKVDSINLAHYKSIIMNHVYPLLTVVTKWYSYSDGTGLLALIVDKKKDGLHIVKDTVEENGSGVHGLNIPLRQDDQTYIYTAEALYELMYRKHNSMPESTFLDQSDTNTAISRTIEKRNSRVSTTGKSIRDSLVGSLDWDELPVMIVQAVAVSGPDRLYNFFDEVANEFRNTIPIRNIGFNLNSFGYEATTTDGAFVKSGVRDIALRLDSDGTTSMAMRGNDAFLGWGVNKEGMNSRIRINSIVLVEVVFEFARFIHQTLTKHGLKSWQYTIDIRRFKEYQVCLNPGGPNALWGNELNVASKDNWLKNVPKSNDYTKDAYQILTEIYALFMLSDKVIPFSNHDSGTVTEETILSINKNLNGY